jgi:hypothetical protein
MPFFFIKNTFFKAKLIIWFNGTTYFKEFILYGCGHLSLFGVYKQKKKKCFYVYNGTKFLSPKW